MTLRQTPSRRALILAAMGLATAAAAPLLPSGRRTRSRGLVLETALPVVLGPWRQDIDARPILPDDSTERSVENTYDSWVARVYRRADGASIMYVLAYGDASSRTIAIHRPETCYSAQGFTVEQRPPLHLPPPLAAVTVSRLVAVRGDRIEPVIFWMTIAGRQSNFGIAQNLALIQAAWQSQPADGLLVRASTLGADEAGSFAMIQDFLSHAARGASKTLRDAMGIEPGL